MAVIFYSSKTKNLMIKSDLCFHSLDYISYEKQLTVLSLKRFAKRNPSPYTYRKQRYLFFYVTCYCWYCFLLIFYRTKCFRSFILGHLHLHQVFLLDQPPSIRAHSSFFHFLNLMTSFMVHWTNLNKQ